MYVKGDGNCCWRSLSQSIWGFQGYWMQLKLFVLAWSVANAEALVIDEGGILTELGGLYWNTADHAKYSRFSSKEGNDVSTSDDKLRVLMACVGRFCKPKQWGGDLTLLLASQALRIKVKMVNPSDRKWRLEYDARGERPAGFGRKGSNFEDCRLSREFAPDTAQLVYHVHEEGAAVRVIEEVVVVLVDGCRGVGEEALDSIPEITKDSTLSRGLHFASISRTDNTTPPFPLFKVAPALFEVNVSFFYVVLLHEVVQQLCVVCETNYACHGRPRWMVVRACNA